MKWKCSKCNAINDEPAGICITCYAIKPDDVPLLPDEAFYTDSIVKKGAGFCIRLGARMIDTFVGIILALFLSTFAGIVFYLLAHNGIIATEWETNIRNFSFLGFFVGLLGAYAYQSTVEGIASTSIGKSICGLRVVNLEGHPISFVAALKRGLAYYWDSLFFGIIGYGSMKKSPLQQRYGDVWARTIVVKKSDFTQRAPVGRTKMMIGAFAGLVVWSIAIGAELFIKAIKLP